MASPSIPFFMDGGNAIWDIGAGYQYALCYIYVQIICAYMYFILVFAFGAYTFIFSTRARLFFCLIT